ncbi:uncharacterized protein LOC119995535 [Tripterygium wilfordii]|uniref:uncharacterized protein LOC119995535 n=1 Tax=Tripterygium wilfordii TaxID=458696 RepID=UPI0018F7E717|nr:uncharacterized protein LOC119995535 [Tripterygium wilfordii]
MCTPKQVGGMDFRNFEALNESLPAKQRWRILKIPESLSSKELKAKYFQNSDFLLVEKCRHSYYLWTSLMDARSLLEDGFKWLIGNGLNVHIWQDYWFPKPNTTLIEQFFGQEEARLILKQPWGSEFIVDTLCWSGTTNGEYSVKSGYHKSMEIRRRSLASSSGCNSMSFGRDAFCASTKKLQKMDGIFTDKTVSTLTRGVVCNERGKGPRRNYIKINWDAAIENHDNYTSLGVIYRDMYGDLMVNSSLVRKTTLDPTHAEAMGALYAVQMAFELGFLLIILEGDSSLVVEAIRGEEMRLSTWGAVVMEIHRLLSYFVSWSVHHVHRKSNYATHCLAKFVVLDQQWSIWIEDSPECVLSIVEKEKVNCGWEDC